VTVGVFEECGLAGRTGRDAAGPEESDLTQTPTPHSPPQRPDASYKWSIGIYLGPTPLSLSPAERVTNPVLTAADVTDLRAEFVADPFLVRAEGRWFLFFEVMPCDAREGVIALAESGDGLRWSYRGVVLREPFHLSYPHVFTWRGDYYMTPETLAPGRVRLYRAARFPDRWEQTCDLVAGRHADPTVFEAGDSWWLFSCTPTDGNATLCLHRAPAPTGPWVEHPRSPVVADDCRIARPAGRVIAWDGELLRFAQDCAAYYGVRVSARRITRLTPTEYGEEPAGTGPVVGPSGDGWNRWSMHHFDCHPWPAGGWVAAVDAR
jgi:hypothetical protein